MPTGLLSYKQDLNSLQKNDETNDNEKDEIVKDMQEEIDCPRCDRL